MPLPVGKQLGSDIPRCAWPLSQCKTQVFARSGGGFNTKAGRVCQRHYTMLRLSSGKQDAGTPALRLAHTAWLRRDAPRSRSRSRSRSPHVRAALGAAAHAELFADHHVADMGMNTCTHTSARTF